MPNILCLTYGSITHKGVQFDERLVRDANGNPVYLGVATDVTDEATLAYFDEHPSFVVLEDEDDEDPDSIVSEIDNQNSDEIAPGAPTTGDETSEPVMRPDQAQESVQADSAPAEPVVEPTPAPIAEPTATDTVVELLPEATLAGVPTPTLVPFPKQLLSTGISSLEEEVAKISDVTVLEQLINKDQRKPARAVYRQRIRAITEAKA